MKLSNELPLPFPADPQQIELMDAVLNGGAGVASEGTDKYELMEILVSGGFMIKVFCPQAGKVFQFEVTSKGREAFYMAGTS